MFRHILVGYDGSAPSELALEQAYELAHAQEAEVTIVTVAPPVTRYAAIAGASGANLEAELEQWAAETLAEAAASAPRDVVVHTISRTGNAGREMVAELESGDYDLVVLGSRGHGRISSEILGSVNAYVHFHSTVPLLSIRLPAPRSGTRGRRARTPTPVMALAPSRA